MSSQRYFISYQGFSESGEVTVCGNVVVNSPHKLTTSEHMGDLVNQLTEELGRPVVITFLFHMCTVVEGGGDWHNTDWIEEIIDACEGNCDDCNKRRKD